MEALVEAAVDAFEAASSLLGVPFTPDAVTALARALPPLPASSAEVAASPVSRAELRRLLSLAGTPAAEVSGLESGVADSARSLPPSAASEPAPSEEDSEEDPKASSATAPEAPAPPRHHRCQLRATVAVWRGYAVVHAKYEDEVPLSLLKGGAAAVELPGPLPARLTWGGPASALTLDCTGAQPPTWHSDVLPSGLPAAENLARFCVALGARASVVVRAGGGAPLAEAAASAASEALAGDGGGGGGATAGHFPLRLRAVVPAPPNPGGGAATAAALITRRYAWGGVSDGHTLCVALPLGRGAASSVRAECMFLDGALGGVAGVVCPTGAVRVWGGQRAAGGAGARLAAEALGSGGGALLRGSGCCLLLFEPGNVATVWRGLRCGAAGAAPAGLLPPPPGAPPPLQAGVTAGQLPRHVAVIMDGNGRWAAARGLRRTEGHRAGVSAIHTLIRAARRLRIPYLTLYAFSAQNWSRPDAEVKALMELLANFVATDLEELCANGVRLLVNGDEAKLPLGVRGGLARMVDASARNRGLTLCLALSYGGREEIVGAAAAAARAAAAGALDPAALTPEAFRAFLPHPHSPDPDLLLRTSGELRVSNFLLWHIAYAEIYVSAALWPDFGDEALAEALVAYAARERRFGKTGEQVRGEAGGDGGGELNCGGGAPPPAAEARCCRACRYQRACCALLPCSRPCDGAKAAAPPTTAGALLAALLPFLALLAALLLFFSLAPVALRLGLVQAPPPGTCAVDVAAEPSAGDEKPCLVVLLDGGTCSSARKLATRGLHWLLRLRDRAFFGGPVA